MKLNLEQLRAVAQGAVYVTEEDGAAAFHRFTREQEMLYGRTNGEFYRKTFATAGVKLCFRTDSAWMELKVLAMQTMPRTYFALDVAVNGTIIGSVDNVSGKTLPEDYTVVPCELGRFGKRFALGSGVKIVTLYFPWSVDLRMEELALSDGALVEPVRPGKTLLMFGDSITQGYDAIHPSKRYAAMLAEALDAEEINKAIGGEVFFPELARLSEALEPDFITVAYGTNDWSKTERSVLLRNARSFYETLQRNFPKAKLFALLPIWRKDRDEYRPYGSFDQMRWDLAQIAGELGIPVIDCYDFVPEDPAFFADLRLHPNDRGFEAYAKALARAILEVEA